MQLHNPLAVVTPTLDAGVLRVLASADSRFTGRQIARLLPEHSQKGVHNALQRLVEQGIVLRDVVGAAHQYHLNRDHLAAPYISRLAQLRREFDSRVRELVDGWTVCPEALILFGSAARQEMSADSDIDLLVVGPTGETEEVWHQQLTQLADEVTSWTGNDARVLDMRREEVRDALVHGDPLMDDIRREGQVLHGDSRYLHDLAMEIRKDRA